MCIHLEMGENVKVMNVNFKKIFIPGEKEQNGIAHLHTFEVSLEGVGGLYGYVNLGSLSPSACKFIYAHFVFITMIFLYI